MGDLVSDPREDDDRPVSIEADAPEADWIEQHQPVIDEPDDDLFPSQGRDDDQPISIEADAPEADWIEQHQPVIDEPDDDLVPLEVPRSVDDTDAFEEAGRVTGVELDVDDEPPVVPPSPSRAGTGRGAPEPRAASTAGPGARGCNLVGALVHALVRSLQGAAGQVARRDRGSPGRD
jgi:hypothetical protein